MDKKNDFKEKYKYSNQEQRKLYEEMDHILDTFLENNSFENREYMCYLAAAIYLTYKKLYPQFSIHINLRTKSDTSTINNIQKEFNKYFKESNSIEPFNPLNITKDMSGFRLIFDSINFSLPVKDKTAELFADPEISKLISESDDNFIFIRKIEDFLKSPIKTSQEYYKLRQNLIERIVSLTPKEFDMERYPQPSFFELKEFSAREYNYFLENDSFPVFIDESLIIELSDLLNDLRSRLYDPLHFALLKKTLPIVFEQPLIKNVLKTSLEWDKDNLKPNAFQALYYNIHTPFGLVEELQAQSNKAFYASTKGSAYHSGIKGKNIDIKDFFELVDPNDSNELSYYLEELDRVSADSLVSPYELPEFKTLEEKETFLRTLEGRKFLESEKYREMMKHIRIKEKMKLLPQNPPDKKYIPIQHETSNPEKIEENFQKRSATIVDTNEYLLSTALSLSPYMDVCSAGHTSFTTASIHHKKIIGEFSEVLRKKDSNTCLRDMLIRRLEDLIDKSSSLDNDSISKLSPYMQHSLQVIRTHDEMSTKLPKDISEKNILAYGEKLRTMQKNKNAEKSEFEFDK